MTQYPKTVDLQDIRPAHRHVFAGLFLWALVVVPMAVL